MANSELQNAADRGELAGVRASAAASQWQKTIEVLTDRRWIVGKVTEIAVAHTMTPGDFEQFCKIIAEFIRATVPEKSP